jgi:hypothetical protein
MPAIIAHNHPVSLGSVKNGMDKPEISMTYSAKNTHRRIFMSDRNQVLARLRRVGVLIMEKCHVA